MNITNQELNFKRINNLVSGGAGFLGSHLIDKLLSKGENVLCIDNFSTGRTDNINHLRNNSNFSLIQHDVLHPFKSEIPIDKIWHLACPASPCHYQKDPLRTIRINYEGTFNILNLAKDFKSKFLFTSTSEVYGLSEGLIQNEDMLINLSTYSPRACYSEGKRIAETLINVFGKINNFQTRLARVFNTYGPRLNIDDGRVISNFINQSLKNQKITIYGDGLQTRSFCYVNDMVHGLIRLMESEYSKPVNLGTDQEINILDLALLIRSKINPQISLEFFDLPLDDPRCRKPCLDLAKRELGWDPKIDLSEGLEKTVAYFKI
tara:strand:+ start:734 stop:1693 length:960 start_codon:yes stop_codon:yes gene_type:complete